VATRAAGREGQSVNAQQELLRATNTEIPRVSADVNSQKGDFVCECGAKDCDELIPLALQEFDTFCATADGMPLVAERHR